MFSGRFYLMVLVSVLVALGVVWVQQDEWQFSVGDSPETCPALDEQIKEEYGEDYLRCLMQIQEGDSQDMVQKQEEREEQRTEVLWESAVEAPMSNNLGRAPMASEEYIKEHYSNPEVPLEGVVMKTYTTGIGALRFPRYWGDPLFNTELGLWDEGEHMMITFAEAPITVHFFSDGYGVGIGDTPLPYFSSQIEAGMDPEEVKDVLITSKTPVDDISRIDFGNGYAGFRVLGPRGYWKSVDHVTYVFPDIQGADPYHHVMIFYPAFFQEKAEALMHNLSDSFLLSS